MGAPAICLRPVLHAHLLAERLGSVGAGARLVARGDANVRAIARRGLRRPARSGTACLSRDSGRITTWADRYINLGCGTLAPVPDAIASGSMDVRRDGLDRARRGRPLHLPDP